MPTPRIAVLGWGSLIWDPRPDFDAKIGAWTGGGPPLPIELCRISDTRRGALTLVIDHALGTLVETLHAPSRRTNRQDALRDLRDREGTSLDQIGFVDLPAGKERSADPATAAAIKQWAEERGFDVAVWTDLRSNFESRRGAPFSAAAALEHLQSLTTDGLRQAVKYIVRAPPQSATQLRQWLATVAWFQEKVTLFETFA